MIEVPWKDIPKEELSAGDFTLRKLKKYFVLPVLKTGDTGPCCNCGLDRYIVASGLCKFCYERADSKNATGAILLNNLSRARALRVDIPQKTPRTTDNDAIVEADKRRHARALEAVKERADRTSKRACGAEIPLHDKSEEEFQPAKVIGHVELDQYDDNVKNGSACPECDTETTYPCKNIFLVDDMDKENLEVVGRLDNPNVQKNAVLRSEAAEEMQEDHCVEVVSESQGGLTVTPFVKQAIVIEFGDAELEFRAGADTIDIRIEDGGDLIFLARGVRKADLIALSNIITG